MTHPSSHDHSTPGDPRDRLLATLRHQGITDERVLAAMARIPRERFVEPDFHDSAWENVALAIPHGQTISQPLVVGLMTQALALTGEERMLEVGTGSGYQAAILAELAAEVITIERIPALAALAAERFEQLGIRNVRSIMGDGSDGWQAGAPYDAIMVTAGARELPAALVAQLSPERGRMVIPLGPIDGEHLTLLRITDGAITRHDLGAVRFVPLIREQYREQDS